MDCPDNIFDPMEFQQFMQEQCEEMKRHKWIESEKAGHDLGNQAIRDWVYKYAKQFREEYAKIHNPKI